MIDWRAIAQPQQPFKSWVEEELEDIFIEYRYQQRQYLTADDDGMPLPQGYSA